MGAAVHGARCPHGERPGLSVGVDRSQVAEPLASGVAGKCPCRMARSARVMAGRSISWPARWVMVGLESSVMQMAPSTSGMEDGRVLALHDAGVDGFLPQGFTDAVERFCQAGVERIEPPARGVQLAAEEEKDLAPLRGQADEEIDGGMHAGHERFCPADDGTQGGGVLLLPFDNGAEGRLPESRLGAEVVTHHGRVESGTFGNGAQAGAIESVLAEDGDSHFQQPGSAVRTGGLRSSRSTRAPGGARGRGSKDVGHGETARKDVGLIYSTCVELQCGSSEVRGCGARCCGALVHVERGVDLWSAA